MAETQQVHNSSNEEEESPEQETSRSRRKRFKASNMSFGEMVDILKRADYDGKYGQYLNPNVRKAKIMTKVVKSLRRNFGVRRSKEQLRKRRSTSVGHQNKLFKVSHRGEKRLGPSEDTSNTTPQKEGEQRTPQPQDVEEGEVEEVVEIVTTTGDVQVVEEQSTNFTGDSAQWLIQDIMWCSRDLDLIKEKNQGD
ncbi:hypothetical protein AB205_0198070 [Aquarana catesbeiana]|uniref:Uncharacterized protein n=1 Tax=Aquarana catesbeiana TaxID=8400 RepID=A0A2G9QH98_AQUCT|nr:hypothetical protein AB205_0198070 [Aquarana catesbeiana]